MAETVPTRFYEYLVQIYGKKGAERKLASVAEAQQNRPPVVGTLPHMQMDRVFDPVPITFSEQKPLYKGEGAQGLYSPSTRTAQVYSPEGKRLPLMTKKRSENDLDMAFGAMPWQSYVELHERSHDVYRGGKKSTETEPLRQSLKKSLGRKGSIEKELPVYLADVVRWGATKDVPEWAQSKREAMAAGSPAPPDIRNFSESPEEAEEVWDAFGEYLKKQKHGIWNKKRWDEMNKHRDLIINYMPELAGGPQEQAPIG